MSTKNLATVIASKLRTDILTGVLKGGEKLKQDHLASAFDSSHIPVREALMILVSEGLAEHIPRCGVVVSKMLVEDMREIMEMRMALESLMLRLSGPLLTDDHLKTAKLFIKLAEDETDVDKLIDYNWQYHRALYSGIKRPKLMNSIEDVWVHSERYMRYLWARFDFNEGSHQGHCDIYEACTNKDFEKAVSILHDHINNSLKMAEKIIGQES
tara:strand:- start:587 stop:1225 length:639 start_codon:yes stop_codon:yes gene_type:complete